jgi:hypothetical protein
VPQPNASARGDRSLTRHFSGDHTASLKVFLHGLVGKDDLAPDSVVIDRAARDELVKEARADAEPLGGGLYR